MFRFMHRMEIRDNNEYLVIYSFTPVDYEFANEPGSIRKNVISTVGKIREYAQKNLSFLHNTNPTVLLILNGVIIGSVKLTELLSKTKG